MWGYLNEQAFVGTGREGRVWRGWQGGFNAAFLPRALQTCISREKAEEEQCDEAAGWASGGAGGLRCCRHGRKKQTFCWYTNKRERC